MMFPLMSVTGPAPSPRPTEDSRIIHSLHSMQMHWLLLTLEVIYQVLQDSCIRVGYINNLKPGPISILAY